MPAAAAVDLQLRSDSLLVRQYLNSRIMANCFRGVGFLRYWTISNLPLFLLAIPVLTVMLLSSINAFMSSTVYAKPGMPDLLLDRLAAPQFMLAILAITHYHVQIINRLSSGYPWLCIWLAQKICKRAGYAKVAVTFCVMYATIQTGLFASFLPPA